MWWHQFVIKQSNVLTVDPPTFGIRSHIVAIKILYNLVNNKMQFLPHNGNQQRRCSWEGCIDFPQTSYHSQMEEVEDLHLQDTVEMFGEMKVANLLKTLIKFLYNKYNGAEKITYLTNYEARGILSHVTDLHLRCCSSICITAHTLDFALCKIRI